MKYLLFFLILPLFIHAAEFKYSEQEALNIIANFNFPATVANKVKGMDIVRRFGSNTAIGTTWKPVTYSGTYQTPTTAQSLEIVSSSANDAAAGTGARTVKVSGLGEDWYAQTEIVTLNGATAVNLSKKFFRVDGMEVVTSGTYANSASPSHNSTITLRNQGAGVVWAVIGANNGYGLGVSQIGVVAVPKGKRAFIIGVLTGVEATKSAFFALFKRIYSDKVTAPYEPMQLLRLEQSLTGEHDHKTASPLDTIIGPADVGLMAYTSVGTAEINIEFEVLLMDI